MKRLQIRRSHVILPSTAERFNFERDAVNLIHKLKLRLHINGGAQMSLVYSNVTVRAISCLLSREGHVHDIYVHIKYFNKFIVNSSTVYYIT